MGLDLIRVSNHAYSTIRVTMMNVNLQSLRIVQVVKLWPSVAMIKCEHLLGIRGMEHGMNWLQKALQISIQ